MDRLGPLVRVRAVQPLEPFKVRLTFADETQKIVDLEPYLHGPIFEPIRQSPRCLSFGPGRRQHNRLGKRC